MNILFIIKVKVLVLIRWSYRFLQLCWQLALEWIHILSMLQFNLFETHVSFGICSYTTITPNLGQLAMVACATHHTPPYLNLGFLAIIRT